ncbi:MAG: prolipoprotein diacylglyceryl transferase [Pseudomonadota bacterium]|nr:prolipoprotein diacylglyceryl transferase [Pseudomonadota bacterium]
MTIGFPLTEHPHLVHAVFEALALCVGAFYYRIVWRRLNPEVASPLRKDHFPVLLGCILGAALGNKVVFWIEVPHLLSQYWQTPTLWLGGQSIVGGLLGGLIGVELAKKWAGIQRSTGDTFVFPILLGLIIGRIGCFLAGLADGTYGVATEWPWGIDLGDGIPRHPTSVYEILFAILLWGILHRLQPLLAAQPGLLFKIMLSSYLLWRLGIETLKPLPFNYALGLSGIQVVCLIALLIYLPLTLRQFKRVTL